MTNLQRTVVFSDFDGTISTRDVGNRLFNHFSGGRSDLIVEKWKAGEINARKCLSAEADLIQVTESQLHNYLNTFTLDPEFTRFEQLCRQNSIDLHIVSDGLDLYIKYLLEKHNFGHLPVMANTGRLENDRIIVDYPYEMGVCGICGNCKGDRIRQYLDQADDQPFIIFIGDGLSDRCATTVADQIFAKNDLAFYCKNSNIQFNSFDTFDDIIRVVETSGRFNNNPPEREDR